MSAENMDALRVMLARRVAELEEAIREINRDAWADDNYKTTLRKIARYTDELLRKGKS